MTPRTPALDRAKAFLRGQLANGPRPIAKMKAAATVAGVSATTLNNARRDLGLVAFVDRGVPWSWALPENAPPGMAERHRQRVLDHRARLAEHEDSHKPYLTCWDGLPFWEDADEEAAFEAWLAWRELGEVSA